MTDVNSRSVTKYDPEPPLEILDQRKVFREYGGADFQVEEINTKIRDSGDLLTFHVASVKNAHTGVVCVARKEGGSDDDEASPRYLIARHWRVSTGCWGWEFPRGMGKDGETPIQTAVREFTEETGILIDENQVRILQHMHADTGVLKDDIAVARISILGTEKSAAESDWELADPVWLTTSQVRNMIAMGELRDGITLAAFTIETTIR